MKPYKQRGRARRLRRSPSSIARVLGWRGHCRKVSDALSCGRRAIVGWRKRGCNRSSRQWRSIWCGCLPGSPRRRAPRPGSRHLQPWLARQVWCRSAVEFASGIKTCITPETERFIAFCGVLCYTRAASTYVLCPFPTSSLSVLARKRERGKMMNVCLCWLHSNPFVQRTTVQHPTAEQFKQSL